MKEKPKLIASKIIHDDWLKLRVDTLQVPGVKEPYRYEVVVIPGDGVAALAFLDPDTLLLARQYRHPVSEYLLELIQGGVKKKETIEEAARRELLEETGYDGKIEYLNTMYPMPGSLDMRINIVRATNLRKVQEPSLHGVESLEVVTRSYQGVVCEVLAGRHKDSALVWAVLYHEILTSLNLPK